MRQKKVLLSDDVELFLMLEKSVFNRNEFALITARSGRDILKLINKEEPELVFINLYMPEMNGDECCRIVKGNAQTQHIPIIIVVQGTKGKDLGKCRKSGCDDILYKPIIKKDFMKITRKFLHVLERAEKRLKTRLRVKYSVKTLESYYNYSIDINTGGLFLETENPLTVDTPIDLEFQLPDVGSVIRCKARGAWVNDPKERKKPNLPAGMGMQFMDLSHVDMMAINDYVNNLNRIPMFK
jgi:uncharacterized protein (TIGR02266 family)